MSAWRAILGITIVTLLLAFSFNAYACLLPIYGGVATPEGGSCSTSDEQSARQFCDTFKTLGMHAAPDLPLAIDREASLAERTASFEDLVILQARNLLARSSVALLPSDLHVRSSVLRL